MNNQVNLTGRFFVSLIAFFLRSLLTPLYFAIRTDMGVQFTGTVSMLGPVIIYGCVWKYLYVIRARDTKVFALYFALVAVGYIRNALQARHRRRVRDWSVHSWSSGKSLLQSVFLLAHLRLRNRCSRNRRLRRLCDLLVNMNFIYYVAEPFGLFLFAKGLHSIGSMFYFYPLVLAVALVVVRNEVQMHDYLLAHEVVDGKMLERDIKWQLEGLAPGRIAIPVAQIASARSSRPATDSKSVFDRLSPELQMLLMRDRAAQQVEHFRPSLGL